MIFVAVNYRVGPFGFLASETIRKNGDLNVGMLDQRFALEWVQRNIKAVRVFRCDWAIQQIADAYCTSVRR